VEFSIFYFSIFLWRGAHVTLLIYDEKNSTAQKGEDGVRKKKIVECQKKEFSPNLFQPVGVTETWTSGHQTS